MNRYQIVDTPAKLEAWCRTHRKVEWLAFDTEFIAENHYKPLLCLVQIASPKGFFLLDPIRVEDTTPFWELLVEGAHKTIVHAGQSELGFCYRYTGRFPRRLFDVQIAAGLVGIEFPAGYTNLVHKVLGQSIPGTESRTNWKLRPLTQRQVEYALDDVTYLRKLETVLKNDLRRLSRRDWYREEIVYQLTDYFTYYSSPQWRRLVRGASLDASSLAVVRALWHWREGLAKRRNCLPRRVLRDDLIMECAKRKLADIKSLQNIRGMEHSDMKRLLPEITRCVADALALPPEACPHVTPSRNYSRLAVAGQLLYSALGSVCHHQHLAVGLLGSQTDVKEWIAWRLRMYPFETAPKLAHGWRAEVVGQLFDDLLTGRRALRITDPRSECPVDFVRYEE